MNKTTVPMNPPITPLQTNALTPMLQVLREMHDGVLLCDTTGKIRWLSDALKTMLGLPPEMIHHIQLGTLDWDHFPLLDLEDDIHDVLTSGDTVAREFKYRYSSLQHGFIKRNFLVHVMLLSLSGEEATPQQPTWCVAIFRDITTIKTTEKMRRDFVANVSHELRTPLSVIKGYTETLMNGAVKELDVATDFLDTIFNHANRLSRLVDDLLDLSRLESMDFRPELEPTDIRPIIESMVRELAPNAHSKDHTLLIELPEDLPLVLVHRPSLEQVLTNFLDNAMKYTPDGGRITISAATKGNMLQVSISDTGIGIDPKHIPRLFERFYRVDKARSRDMGGTGLGLSIVKHIIQTHGGNVWVDSVPRVGTTFHFTLRQALPHDPPHQYAEDPFEPALTLPNDASLDSL